MNSKIKVLKKILFKGGGNLSKIVKNKTHYLTNQESFEKWPNKQLNLIACWKMQNSGFIKTNISSEMGGGLVGGGYSVFS